MFARWIATVAALLLVCAQASAHVRSERATDLGTFAAHTEHALEIQRSAANASPGELPTNPKIAPPARASLENSASGKNALISDCHVWENWSPLKKCASGVHKYLYGNGNPGSYIDPGGRVGFLTDLRDWFNETDRNLREYAENTPYVGGAIGLVRGATSLASAPVRAVNTASDAVAGALPFEVTSGVAEEGAIAFGESVDLGVYVANNKAAVAGAIKDNVIDTASRTFFDRDGAAASDFVSGFTQLAVPSPAIAGGVASTVGRLTPSVTRGLQTASRGLAAVRDRVVQAFRVAESPSGSLEMRFDTDGEAGSGFPTHPQGTGFRPSDFGLRSIASEPAWHDAWTRALKSAAGSRDENAYQRLLRARGNGETVSGDQMASAFTSVGQHFRRIADADGVEIPSGPLHHWNFSKPQYPHQVFDPRNIFPTRSAIQHQTVHWYLGVGKGFDYRGPVRPDSVIDIDDSFYPIPPGYFDVL